MRGWDTTMLPRHALAVVVVTTVTVVTRVTVYLALVLAVPSRLA